MANMTGAAFYAYLLREFKRTDKETEAYEAITDTVMDLRRRFKWEAFKVESYTSNGISSLGDYKIDLPTDFGHLMADVRLIDGTSSAPLCKKSKAAFNELYPNQNDANASRGIPQDYCIFGNQILIGPVPDSTGYLYELDYTKEEAAAIVAGTSSVPFANLHREVLRNGVLMRLYRGMRQFQTAKLYEADYEKGVDDAVTLERRNTGVVPVQKAHDV